MKIEELKRLEKAATPGPWVDTYRGIESDSGACIVDDLSIRNANAAMIAAARNALPALLAMAEAAKDVAEAVASNCGEDTVFEPDVTKLRAALAELDVTK